MGLKHKRYFLVLVLSQLPHGSCFMRNTVLYIGCLFSFSLWQLIFCHRLSELLCISGLQLLNDNKNNHISSMLWRNIVTELRHLANEARMATEVIFGYWSTQLCEELTTTTCLAFYSDVEVASFVLRCDLIHSGVFSKVWVNNRTDDMECWSVRN